MKRGVIASPALIKTKGTGFTIERTLSPQEIRYYFLYWDRVIIPGTNLVYIGIPDEDILIETGVIERPKVQFQGSFSGKDTANSFATAQSLVAEKLIQEDKSIDWVIHQIGSHLNIPNDYTKKMSSLRIDLIDTLPVPNGDVPIADILEFKNRRSDEFNQLHNSIDELYLEALNCLDQDLGNKKALENLKTSIKNLETVSNEKWNRTSKFNLTAEFNLDGGKLAQGLGGGAAFDFFTTAMTLTSRNHCRRFILHS